MIGQLRAYEMVEGTTPEEAGLMKQQRRIEAAQSLRQRRKAGEAQGTMPHPPAPASPYTHAAAPG